MRLINADKLYAVIERKHRKTNGETQKAMKLLLNIISSMETVNLEPLVRCKDCAHCAIWTDGEGFTCQYNEMDYYSPHYSPDTYFCGDAMRREEEYEHQT